MKAVTMILLMVLVAFASDSLFSEANRLYDEQLYDSAATLYSQTIQERGESSALYFNLGNCSYRMGSIGEAILYTEKALQLSPEDEDIRTNLEYLQTQIVDEIPVPELNPIGAAVVHVHELFSLKEQLVIFVVLSFVLLILVGAILFRSGSVRIWAIYGAGTVILFLLLVGGSAGVKIHQLETVHYVVVLDESVEARSEPGNGELIFTAHEGTKMKLLSAQGTWLHVTLPNGTAGYIKEKSVGRI